MCWGYMQNGAVEVTPYSVNRNSPRRRVWKYVLICLRYTVFLVFNVEIYL